MSFLHSMCFTHCHHVPRHICEVTHQSVDDSVTACDFRFTDAVRFLEHRAVCVSISLFPCLVLSCNLSVTAVSTLSPLYQLILVGALADAC